MVDTNVNIICFESLLRVAYFKIYKLIIHILYINKFLVDLSPLKRAELATVFINWIVPEFVKFCSKLI